MKFVALLSGGKDSCYNACHCIVNGHELVALANLHPPSPPAGQPRVHELDSFMFQTVGHTVLPLYAECFGVPLYRRVTKGMAVAKGLYYTTTARDETEDMYELLLDVKRKHPDVEGVSIGAILSTYQRVRVENVCARLGLVSLAYLWRRDQAALLDEMIAAGVHAILVKVAGADLTAERHLGRSLAQVRGDLHRLHDIYGSHICGEGGEYETLVLDCPAFTKASIVVDKTAVVKDPHGGVAYLKLAAHTVPRESEGDAWKGRVAVPPLLDSPREDDEDDREDMTPISGYMPRLPILTDPQSPYVIVLPNITSSAPTFEIEINRVFEKLENRLAEARSDELPTDVCLMDKYGIASVTLILADINNFAAANAAYKQFFAVPQEKANPPARVCVCGRLPAGVRVSLTAVATIMALEAERQGMHVQSRSYWAPANIGPYSQAITMRESVWLAGQIPLVPKSMTLYEQDGVRGQAKLALQNLRYALQGSIDTLMAGDRELKMYYLVAYATDEEAANAAVQVATEEGLMAAGGMFAVEVMALPAGAKVEYTGVGIKTGYRLDTEFKDAGDSEEEQADDSDDSDLNAAEGKDKGRKEETEEKNSDAESGERARDRVGTQRLTLSERKPRMVSDAYQVRRTHTTNGTRSSYGHVWYACYCVDSMDQIFEQGGEHGVWGPHIRPDSFTVWHTSAEAPPASNITAPLETIRAERVVDSCMRSRAFGVVVRGRL
ncbi:uncharacterized protein V1518DRAFT_416584 [Limtongia smithiae]|uniref:uncharacterized protein n=1 Tax=Limtongia smithiae TaxID=1125753 RepID=UPI0034D0049A